MRGRGYAARKTRTRSAFLRVYGGVIPGELDLVKHPLCALAFFFFFFQPRNIGLRAVSNRYENGTEDNGQSIYVLHKTGITGI